MQARDVVMTIGFQCAHCDLFFDWDSGLQIDSNNAEIKTIGSKFCVGCIDHEVAAHGMSRERVLEMRKRRGERLP